jgi:chlorobactene glucosyltransferase
MIYQLIIAALLLCFALNLFLNLRSLKRPRLKSKLPEPAPLVSILVPARNEEINIRNCLESLRKQDYPNLEILVLDDNSTDNTSEIVRQMISEDGRIQLLHGEALPPGWAGKPFACYQLARKARGDWLLFVDADTTHSPQMLRGVMALALDLKPALLSGFPRQLANSVSQQIAIPVLYFVLLSWLPLWWIHRSKKLRPSLAIGQFLLFSKEAYWRMGGHQVVKSRILEDVWLGIEITRAGGRHIAVDLSDITACSMYRSLGAMSEGFVRWIYSVAALSPAALGAMMVGGYVCYLAPFFWLWRGVTMGYSAPWLIAVAVQVVIVYSMRYLLDTHFKNSLLSSLLHPLGFIFLFLSCFRAIGQQVTGVGVYWKKRLYDKESCVK